MFFIPQFSACGEDNPAAKLTWGQVDAIRTAYVPGVVTQRQLARDYGVSESLIGAIVNRKIWDEAERLGEYLRGEVA